MSADAGLIPDNEAQRLAAVRRYAVLDTPPDGAFDRVTALAARHFDVPIALVTIVDTDRIWFKSAVGLDASEIDRDPGLCASAILQDGPWIVEDAAIDPRTLANPLVAGEMGLRFYAAAPLTTHDGFNLGTLCVIDRQPREVTAEDAGVLSDLAAIVTDELELRLSTRTLVEREQTLRSYAESTARVLQASLLPAELPAIPGASLAAFYRPASDSEVGGDFYDVYALGPGRWAIALGDVSGKGAAAAAVTALARHSLRTASMAATDPAEAMAVLNQAMFLGHSESVLDHYCTAHLSFLEAGHDGFTLRSASAGHPAGLVASREPAAPAPLAATGPPVGWHADAAFAATERRLASGDALLLYTDGLSEARRGGELLGEPPIAAALVAGRGQGADAICGRLLELLTDPAVEVRDDAACLVLELA